MSKTTGIGDAIKAAGSQAKLGALLGVSQQYIAKCAKAGFVPPARAVEIETQLGIPRSRLINPILRDRVGAGE